MANEFDGYGNWATRNVALWLSNDYPLYCVVQGFKGYKTPFLSLRRELMTTFGFTLTKDGVSLWDGSLDIAALNDLITEA